jgi:GT2 family glycosyltransferase
MIVILSFNHPELTTRTLQSAQSFVSDQDLLLVHNGSRQSFIDQLQKTFPTVQHLILETNRGYSGGVNAGLRVALRKSPWALLLTNDCQLLKYHHPSSDDLPALKAPQIFARKRDRIDSLGGAFEPLRGKLSHLKKPEELGSLQTQSFKHRRLPYIPGSAFWIHRDVFAATGDFDEGLGTYWEDVDFSVRAWRKGVPLIVDLQTQVLHSIGKTCHKNPHYTTYLYQRNRRLISKKYLRELQLSSPIQARLRWQLTFDYSRLLTRFLRQRDWNKISLLWKSLKG